MGESRKVKYEKPMSLDAGKIVPTYGAECNDGSQAIDGCGFGNNPDLVPACTDTGSIADTNCNNNGASAGDTCSSHGESATQNCNTSGGNASVACQAGTSPAWCNAGATN